MLFTEWKFKHHMYQQTVNCVIMFAKPCLTVLDKDHSIQHLFQSLKVFILQSKDGVINEEIVLTGDEGSVSKTQDEMTSMIEKSRKNMVIKLKGETKKVNPKTGKTYDENPKGSAIQVVGQRPVSTENRSLSGTGRSSPILTLSGGVARSPSPVTIGSLVRSVPLALPMSRPIPHPTTPGNYIPTVGSYVHPYTGQAITYGSNAPGQQPLATQVEGESLQGPQHNLLQVSQRSFDDTKGTKTKKDKSAHASNSDISQAGMSIQTIGQHNSSTATGSAKRSKSSSDKTSVSVSGKKGSIKKRSQIDQHSDHEVKKMKLEPETKNIERHDSDNKNFGSRILETLDQVKSANKSPQKETDRSKKEETKTVIKTKSKPSEDIVVVMGSDESELEDGEISDDSDTDDVPQPRIDTRVVHDSAYRRQDDMDSRYNNDMDPRYNNYNYQSPTKYNYNSPPNRYDSPKRIVNFRGNYPSQMPPVDGGKFTAARYVGADWADFIENPTVRVEERIRATNIQSPSLNTGRGNSQDESDLLSKSVASINKSKQKIVAQSQVKTLGEWLKIELETDNIQPLADIVPYSFDTDLSGISKTKRRKIRLKVKNIIGQEGVKRAKVEQEKAEMGWHQEIEKQPSNPSYLPEVHNDELEGELKLLSEATELVKRRVMHLEQNSYRPAMPGTSFAEDRMGIMNGKRLIIAMTLVESEMKQLLYRTCYYGYPHRRVPEELLLSKEHNTFKIYEEDVFLILMMPISAKPYAKLLQLKTYLEELYTRLAQATADVEKEAVKQEIVCEHGQRQSLLRSFTGYLNKKRIQKIQETADKYTLVFEHFKALTPPPPAALLKHIRTTQMDLRQHLILAKQYLVGNMCTNHTFVKVSTTMSIHSLESRSRL